MSSTVQGSIQWVLGLLSGARIEGQDDVPQAHFDEGLALADFREHVAPLLSAPEYVSLLAVLDAVSLARIDLIAACAALSAEEFTRLDSTVGAVVVELDRAEA
jgi:hypothetical protein